MFVDTLIGELSASGVREAFVLCWSFVCCLSIVVSSWQPLLAMHMKHLKTLPWDLGNGSLPVEPRGRDRAGELATDEKGNIDEKNGLPPPQSPAIGSERELMDTYGIDERKLLRKLDLHLLPGPCILYLLSFLDRST